ncbi:MAG: hybrid sensor histidine kinase/response regulator, partial [Gemmatimonadales bacterium]
MGLTLLAPTAALAQSGQPTEPSLDPARELTQYTVESWGEREGLPQNFVHSIVQSADGYLWLGTARGLARFDGTRFTVFDQRNVPAFETNWVKTLWADPDGTVWIGLEGQGILRYRDGEFTALEANRDLASVRINTLFRDADGVLWVGTEGGGIAWLDSDDRFHGIDTSDGLSDNTVHSITQDRTGAIWVGTVAGLDRLQDGQIQRWGVEEGLPDDHIYQVVADPAGGIWIGTAAGGLARLDDQGITTFGPAEGLTDPIVNALFQDRRGTLWIGTNGSGLFRLADGTITHLDREGGLPSDLVWDITEDREGNLWLGLAAVGLARLQDGVFRTMGEREGLSSPIALALLEDRDETMWVGTAGGGLNRIRDGEITTFTTSDGLAHDIILTLAQGMEGDIWIGTVAGGITRIRGDDVRTYTLADGLISLQNTVIHPDGEGGFWLGTNGSGVQRWSPEGVSEVYTQAQGLPSDFITSLRLDSGGRLWIGTRGGLATHEAGEIRVIGEPEGMHTDGVNALYEDASGAIWAATMRGLVRIHDGVAHHFLESSGMSTSDYLAVVEDHLGYLWLSSNQGITRVLRAELDEIARGDRIQAALETFGRADGLRSAEANGGVHPAGLRRADGSIWFPTMAGAVAVDPESVDRDWSPPIPLVQFMVAGDTIIPTGQPIRLPPGHQTLEFHFTAPIFTAPERTQFRYRLEGFDSEWVYPQDRRAAYYTNLPPRWYRFRVGTGAPDGTWTESEALVEVELSPQVYERRSVQALLLLLLLGSGLALYLWRMRRLRRREEELLQIVDDLVQAQEALQKSEGDLRQAQKMDAVGRLAGGMAHDFNNLLSVIGANAQLAYEDVPETNELAREEIQEVILAGERAAQLTRQLLAFSRKQVLEPQVLDLNEVVQSVERMLRRLIREDIIMQARLHSAPCEVLADKTGVEQILVNLVVNARDAMPGGGTVEISTGPADPDGFFVLSVRDTGTGMDEETLRQIFEPFFTTKRRGEGTGLGLSTVYGIAKQSGGWIDVESEMGVGTVFRVFLPAAPI